MNLNKKKYSVLLITMLAYFFCQSQNWTLMDIGTEETLNKVYFVDNNKGFIIGDNGTLFKTNDGGNNWAILPTGISHSLETITFSNENVGYINGLKTTDGGETWFPQTATEIYGPIHALDEDTLIAGIANNISGDIFKSTDGGQNWGFLANPINSSTGIYSNFYFVNDNIGYLTAWYSDHLLKTINGGDTWNEIVIDTVDGVGFSTDDFYSVQFPSIDIGLITHESGILKTQDGGMTWSEIKPSTPLFDIRAMSIFANSEDNYIAVGTSTAGSGLNENIFETSDGGSTWTESTITTPALLDVYCTTDNCYAVGFDGAVYTKMNNFVNTSEIFESSGLKIFPNPTNDYLYFKSDNISIDKIEIIDLNGTVCYESTKDKNKVDVSYLSCGAYLVKIKTSGF